MSEQAISKKPENREEQLLEPGERLSAPVGTEGRRSRRDDTDLSKAIIVDPPRSTFDALSASVDSVLRKPEQS